MTSAQDIREVIREHAIGDAERRSLEAVSGALEERLAVDVPHRPEFKAQLRRQLMVQARRALVPWYRRPAVIYPSMAVAAACAVLVVGLRLWSGPVTPGAPATPAAEAPNVTAKSGDPTPRAVGPVRMVGSEALPAVTLPDEILQPGEPGPALALGLDLSQVKVYLLSTRPDRAQFGRIAQGMDFARSPETTATGFRVTEGSRALALNADGHVLFEDKGAGSPADPPLVLDATAVRSAAQAFLVRAGLPVPGLEPQVAEGAWGDLKHVYSVTYTPTVDGRPIVNGRTTIRMTDRYRIATADAYVQADPQVLAGYGVIAPAEAIARAQAEGGGTFSQADLGYARTADDQAIYLQPVWRVFGTDAGGQRMVRYVPALKP